MKTSTRVYLVIQLCMFILLSLSHGASAKSRSKKKTTKEVKEVNICDLERRDAPIYCYCVNHHMKNSTDANCVVFNKFDIDDPIWSHFASQQSIDKLTFTVKHSGSFTYVPTQAFKQLKNLQVVTVQYAKIHEIVEHAFSNMSSIVEINLSRNMIFVLKKFAFENMKNLSIVNLDENRIAEVNR